MFELSDLMPSRLHLIVPPGFRRNAPIPETLALHRAALVPREIEARQGYRVVRPLRAIADLLHEDTADRSHLRAALRQALDRGLVTRTELNRHPACREMTALLGKRAAYIRATPRPPPSGRPSNAGS